MGVNGQFALHKFHAAHVGSGSFSSDQPAPDALGMSASLRSRPNLRTAANRRGVPGADICTAAKIASFRFLNVMSWRSKNYQSALRLAEFAGPTPLGNPPDCALWKPSFRVRRA